MERRVAWRWLAAVLSAGLGGAVLWAASLAPVRAQQRLADVVRPATEVPKAVGKRKP